MSSKIPIYTIDTLKSYKNDGILVSEFSHYLSQNHHLLSAHKHTFYHLMFFTEGDGEQQIDFKKFPVKPGLIYFMIPGQVHHWNFSSQPSGYIINFSKNYFNSFLLETDYLTRFNFFSGKPSSQVIELPLAIQQKIIIIFEEILNEGRHDLQVNDDLVKTLLLRLFIEIARFQITLLPVNNNKYNHTILSNFIALIENHYKELKLPKQYAELLYITPNHLNALCKDFLRTSAGTLIRERVLLEAKRLLINVDLRISEIADLLNFTDQSYFIKFFKKYEGITPEKFRKTITVEQSQSDYSQPKL